MSNFPLFFFLGLDDMNKLDGKHLGFCSILERASGFGSMALNHGWRDDFNFAGGMVQQSRIVSIFNDSDGFSVSGLLFFAFLSLLQYVHERALLFVFYDFLSHEPSARLFFCICWGFLLSYV